MKKVDIYIKDRWNGGFKGDGKAVALIVYEDTIGIEHKKQVMVEVKHESRDRLQMMAMTKALHVLKERCSVGIYIDNELLKNAIGREWCRNWQKNDWKNAKGKDVKNADIWMILVPLLDKHEVGVMGYIARYEPDMEKALEN